MQQFQSLCAQFGIEKIDPGQVPARLGEADDKTKSDRVFGGENDDGNRRSCRLSHEHRGNSAHGDYAHLSANQIGS
jgi:hypothetical protein